MHSLSDGLNRQGPYHLKGALKTLGRVVSLKLAHLNGQQHFFLFRRLKDLFLKPIVARTRLPVDVSGRPPVLVIPGAEYVDGILNRALGPRHTEEIPPQQREGLQRHEPGVHDDGNITLCGLLPGEETEKIAPPSDGLVPTRYTPLRRATSSQLKRACWIPEQPTLAGEGHLPRGGDKRALHGHTHLKRHGQKPAFSTLTCRIKDSPGKSLCLSTIEEHRIPERLSLLHSLAADRDP